MSKQVYYEDIDVGTELTSLKKHITLRQLVLWATASNDIYELHYDRDFARSQGLKDPIVHGRLKAAFLGQLVTDYISPKGMLKKLSVRYLKMDYVDEDIVCKGKVTKKYQAEGQNLVECELWTENPSGDKTTSGMATFSLPAKDKR